MTFGPWSAPAYASPVTVVWSLPATVDTRNIQNPVWFAKTGSSTWVALELSTID